MRRRELVFRNLVRHRRSGLFCMMGLLMGLSVLTFVGSMAWVLHHGVLQRIAPSDLIELVPTATPGLGEQAPGIPAATLEALRALDAVEAVHVRHLIAFPAHAIGGGAILGRDLWSELVADGLSEALVTTEHTGERAMDAFRDWEAVTCQTVADCPPSHTCEDSACVGTRCVPSDEVLAFASQDQAMRASRTLGQRFASPARFSVRHAPQETAPWRVALSDGPLMEVLSWLLDTQLQDAILEPEDTGCPEAPTWCSPARRHCAMPVPVVLHPLLLDLANDNLLHVLRGGSDARLRRIPRVDAGLVRGMTFDALLGRGFLGEASALDANVAEVERVRLRIVGFHPQAISVGATLPASTLERWNHRYAGPDTTQPRSVLVQVTRASRMQSVLDVARETLELQPHPRAETLRSIARAVWTLTGVLFGLGLLLLGLAILHILHTFLMSTAERRIELGIMRALGASRSDILRLLLAEAAAIGWLGSVLGVALGAAASHVARSAVVSRLEGTATFALADLSSPLWLLGLGLILGPLCAMLGAFLPAWQAARLDPADAFREGE